jgi:cellulose synthase/poly-beta-1,6-N-acetylglucosamine synthase-like glycosyltransferase
VSLQALLTLLEGIALLIIWVGLAQNMLHAVQLALAARALANAPPELDASALWRRYADAAPAVSILAPAFNEAATVVAAVRALLTIRYPNFEVIVINDGSSDGTLVVLEEAFDLTSSLQREVSGSIRTAKVLGVYRSRSHPRLVVINKENGGKSDALNAGINYSRAPLFCAIDADSILEPDALLHAVRPFLEDAEHVMAAGGTVRVGNGCRADHGSIVDVRVPTHPLALMQAIEYIRAFLIARLGWGSLGVVTIISGAFGVFRHSAVVAIGGYAADTVGEDMELVVRLHRHFRNLKRRYRIVFVPEPVCWTEAPESLDVLSRQRRRWQRGALETCQRHLPMFLNPRYGRVGLLGLTAIFLIDVAGPVAELVGYSLIPVFAALHLLSIDYLVAFLLFNLAFGVALSVAALALEEGELRRVGHARDLAWLLAAAIAENFGYRQLNALWRVQGLWDWFMGVQAWGSMTRRGFRSP